MGPDEVWVDDDFCYRTRSQQCFCPLHLQRFKSITGRSFTRKKLIPAITTKGLLPNDLTCQWGQMQHDGLVEFARVIADAVREENLRVLIAFMGITLKVPFYGTDTLRRLGRNFSPGTTPLLRPEFGAYSDEDHVGWNAYATRWCTQRAFGDRFEAWPELETWPQIRFNHGTRVVEIKLLWGAVHGFISSTVNVSDEPRMIATVARAKRQVTAIGALLHQAPWQARGVSLELGETSVGLRPKPGPVTLSHESATALARLGIPLWPDGGCGRILVGNSPLPRQDELAGFAREGLILDREAFEHAVALGRDDVVGGVRSRPLDTIPARERYSDYPRNGSASGHVMSMELAVPVRPTIQGFDLPGSDEFAELSYFESADGRVLSPGVWTRQWSGGRLVVLPFSLQEVESKNALLNTNRQAQLVSLLSWVSEKPLPVHAEGFPDLAVAYREISDQRRILIGLATFALDDAEEFSLVVSAIPEGSAVEVSVLNRAARWRQTRVTAAAGGVLQATKDMVIPAQSVRAFELQVGRMDQ